LVYVSNDVTVKVVLVQVVFVAAAQRQLRVRERLLEIEIFFVGSLEIK
jgi:hypothetical protein